MNTLSSFLFMSRRLPFKITGRDSGFADVDRDGSTEFPGTGVHHRLRQGIKHSSLDMSERLS